MKRLFVGRARGLCQLLMFACLSASAATALAETIIESPTPAVNSAGVLQQDIGVQMANGALVPLLQRGCQAPCSVNQVLSPVVAGQSVMQLRLYRYASGPLRNASSLGLWSVSGISVEDGVTAQVALVVQVRRNAIALQAIDLRTRGQLPIVRAAP